MKKYIITDPCYIMNKAQYDEICETRDCDFEGQLFPMDSKHQKDGDAIRFLTIRGTGGDGSTEYNGENIGVDSGMLCIAEREIGWYNESFGAKFETIEEAMRALPFILSRI